MGMYEQNVQLHNIIIMCLQIIIFKAILQDVMGRGKFLLFIFFIIHLCNALVVTVFYALSVFMLGTLRKMEYCTQHALPFNTTMQALPISAPSNTFCSQIFYHLHKLTEHQE